ncbi:hypothetical protein CBR_g41794 [Chara braunii]|uniref:Uncharacterized protein n=1 Tax=Chara braunii TaxID=69332 RepID=A0A388LWY9_CHABU|nr:hypothetical protein CBR_g41794 [Chara braunii]|eukprot:GBG86729.1 hypothetical protein CBR_g41794 [Chara braunii]
MCRHEHPNAVADDVLCILDTLLACLNATDELAVNANRDINASGHQCPVKEHCPETSPAPHQPTNMYGLVVGGSGGWSSVKQSVVVVVIDDSRVRGMHDVTWGLGCVAVDGSADGDCEWSMEGGYRATRKQDDAVQEKMWKMDGENDGMAVPTTEFWR